MIALTIAIIGCGIILSISLARFMMKPIEQMERAASKVAAGDLSQTVEVQSKDEIGRFAQQFNVMTAALKNREQQLQESYAELSASEERYRIFIQNSSESIWCFEPKDGKPYPDNCSEDEMIKHLLSDSVVVECNDATAKIYKVKRREELLGRTLSDFLSSTDHERIEHLRTFIRNGYQRTDAERHYPDEHGQDADNDNQLPRYYGKWKITPRLGHTAGHYRHQKGRADADAVVREGSGNQSGTQGVRLRRLARPQGAAARYKNSR